MSMVLRVSIMHHIVPSANFTYSPLALLPRSIIALPIIPTTGSHDKSTLPSSRHGSSATTSNPLAVRLWTMYLSAMTRTLLVHCEAYVTLERAPVSITYCYHFYASVSSGFRIQTIASKSDCVVAAFMRSSRRCCSPMTAAERAPYEATLPIIFSASVRGSMPR